MKVIIKCLFHILILNVHILRMVSEQNRMTNKGIQKLQERWQLLQVAVLKDTCKLYQCKGKGGSLVIKYQVKPFDYLKVSKADVRYIINAQIKELCPRSKTEKMRQKRIFRQKFKSQWKIRKMTEDRSTLSSQNGKRETAINKDERTKLDHPFLSSVFPPKGQIQTHETVHFKESGTDN